MAAFSNSTSVPAIRSGPAVGSIPAHPVIFVGATALGSVAPDQLTRERLDTAIDALIALADAWDGDPDVEVTAIETRGRGFIASPSLIDEAEDDREGDEAVQIDGFNIRNHGRIIR